MWSKVMSYKNMNKYFSILSCLLSIIIAIFVYYTGGTSKVYANLMYIPIAIVSSTRGKKLGITHALISALMIGPFMPLNTSQNLSQQPINWITRLFIYITIAFIIGFFSDYNRQNKEYITNLLTHDMITNFKNIEALKNENITNDYDRTIIALSVIEYEEILSLFGYKFANKTIYKFSKLLKENLQHYKDIDFFRYDGMKFFLVITHKNKEVHIDEIVNELRSLNNYTLIVEDIPIYIELNLGLSNIKRDIPVFEGIRQAFIALRYSMNDNKKIVTFESSLENHYFEIVNIASNFKTAMEMGNIKVAYQNIYNSNTGDIYGRELLVRWITDNGSQIFPNKFIPVIEKTELISELAKYMINAAIEQLLNNRNLVVSINFSPKDFKPEVVNYLIRRVKEEKVNPKNLQVEITEDVLMEKEEAICYLELISNAGLTIAIDDFGSGYSSLGYLSEFPFDIIKIDKSLIQKIDTDTLTRDLVRSVVGFCKSNNVVTIAEGIETKEILTQCKELDIDLLQGYYYHKPTIIENKKLEDLPSR